MSNQQQTSNDNKRYNVVLPEGLFELLQETAQSKNMTVAATLRQFIRLGLVVMDAQDDPQKDVFIREKGHKDRYLYFL